MAKGKWKLVITGDVDPTDADIEHISDMIASGHTEGELWDHDESMKMMEDRSKYERTKKK